MMRTLLFDYGNWGAVLGLLIFLGVFAVMLLWVLRPGAKGEYEQDAKIPLDDGSGGPPNAAQPR